MTLEQENTLPAFSQISSIRQWNLPALHQWENGIANVELNTFKKLVFKKKYLKVSKLFLLLNKYETIFWT